MKISKIYGVGAIVGAVVFGSASAAAQYAQPIPPPPGVVLAPGTAVCPRCQGCRRVASGFLGLNDKRCPECKGTGVVALRGYHPAPPPSPPHIKHHAPPPSQPPHAKPGSAHGKPEHHDKGPAKGHGGPKGSGRR